MKPVTMIDLGQDFNKIISETKLRTITEIYIFSLDKDNKTWTVFIDGRENKDHSWRISLPNHTTKAQAQKIITRLVKLLTYHKIIEILNNDPASPNPRIKRQRPASKVRRPRPNFTRLPCDHNNL